MWSNIFDLTGSMVSEESNVICRKVGTAEGQLHDNAVCALVLIALFLLA
jgi:hypothetical protein